jgi:hypothetical protein
MRTLCEELETTLTHLGAAEGQAWTHSSRMDEQDHLLEIFTLSQFLSRNGTRHSKRQFQNEAQ